MILKERNITMENEKKLPTTAQELTDEEMDKVTGGLKEYSVLLRKEVTWGGIQNVYAVYEWKGTDDNKKYLCPTCHRPVHTGSWGRYYCDPCDESWYFEGSLEMNPNGGWVYAREHSSVAGDPGLVR